MLSNSSFFYLFFKEISHWKIWCLSDFMKVLGLNPVRCLDDSTAICLCPLSLLLFSDEAPSLPLSDNALSDRWFSLHGILCQIMMWVNSLLIQFRNWFKTWYIKESPTVVMMEGQFLKWLMIKSPTSSPYLVIFFITKHDYLYAGC